MEKTIINEAINNYKGTDDELPEEMKIKPKMPHFLKKALKELEPESVNYTKKDEAIDKGLDTLAKVGDISGGIVTGSVIDSLGKKIGSRILKKAIIMDLKDRAKNIKEVGQLTELGRAPYNKMLIDEGRKVYKEDPETAKFIFNNVVGEGHPAEVGWKYVGKTRQHELPLPESYDQVKKETKRLFENSVSKDESKINEVSSGLAGAGSVLSIILEPISTLKEQQDKEISRNMKESALEKVLSTTNNKNANLRISESIKRMSDEEIDNLIKLNINEIKSWYRD